MKQFYEEKVVKELNLPEEVELEAAFLGKSKELLDKIDLSLPLDSTISLFGPFLCYRTHSTEQDLPMPVMLLASQRQLSRATSVCDYTHKGQNVQ